LPIASPRSLGFDNKTNINMETRAKKTDIPITNFVKPRESFVTNKIQIMKGQPFVKTAFRLNFPEADQFQILERSKTVRIIKGGRRGTS